MTYKDAQHIKEEHWAADLRAAKIARLEVECLKQEESHHAEEEAHRSYGAAQTAAATAALHAQFSVVNIKPLIPITPMFSP